jgi:hypothetical protein
MAAEAAAQTTIYYTPYVGDRVPLYNGTEWENKLFTELSIAMAASANWAADSNFDLFVYNDAGTLRLVTGAAWTNGTTRAEALVRTNGIWLNNASFTGRYAAGSTVSIAASRATYVGTMRTTGSTGTTTWELGGSAAGGDPGKLFLWNAYNRVAVALEVLDSTDTWTYNTGTWRNRNGNSNNRVSFVIGLAGEEAVSACAAQGGSHEMDPVAGSTTTQYICVGYDVDNAVDGITSFYAVSEGGAATRTYYPVLVAMRDVIPGIGFHYMAALEFGALGGTPTVLWYGDGGSPEIIRFGMRFNGMF